MAVARDYGKIMNTFWTEWEPRFRKLQIGRDAIAVATYVKTGPTANWLGLYHLAPPLLAHQAGFGKDVKRALKALHAVCDTGYCFWDEELEMIFIPHMAAEEIAKEIVPKDNRHARIVSDLRSFQGCRFALDFCKLYQSAFSLPSELVAEISRLHEAPSKPLQSPLPSPSEAPPKPQAAAIQEQAHLQQQQQQQEQGPSQEQGHEHEFAAAECAAREGEEGSLSGNGYQSDDVDERPLERGEISKALTELGMPENAKPLALADPSLAKVVLAHCSARFKAVKQKPVTNRAGYIRDCLAKPKKYGFFHDGDEWQEPPDADPNSPGNRAKALRQKAEQAAADREREQARRDEEVAIDVARLRRWDALPEADRERFRKEVRKRGGLYIGADENGYMFKFACMELAEREGKL
jgi:hypothetical protein